MGRPKSEIVPTPEESFTIAVAALDDPAPRWWRNTPTSHVHNGHVRSRPTADRAGELLLQLGMSPNVENADHQRALHETAFANSLDVAGLLIANGGD